MAASVITVETVTHRTQMRRFVDVPYLLFGDDPRWSRGVGAYERWRLDEGRHPYFRTGTAAYFLARTGGRPSGRVTAHVDAPGARHGRFGFLAAPDDPAVTEALLAAAAAWLADNGAVDMTGPVSWTEDEEFGVPVAGTEHPGATGRPWHPGHYAAHLKDLGFAAGDLRHTYRVPAIVGDGAAVDPDAPVPAHAGRFADRRLVLRGIAAVPDVSTALRDASLASAWRRARQAAHRSFTTAVCVRCDGPPDVLVPGLLDAAARAGYREVITPWAPPGTAPETSHRLFSRPC